MFVNHIFAKESGLPDMGPCLYEYVVGSNGLFVRAQRPGLNALIWVASTLTPVRGLAAVAPFVHLANRVPAVYLARMFEMAYRAGDKEILFYLSDIGPRWDINLPDQVQGGGSVRPVDPYAGGANTMIEVHSHHYMATFFSGTDDREEQAGFCIYVVIGDLLLHPSILIRVGIYGHFWNVPAAWIFDLPVGVHDALYPEEIEEIIYDERD